MKKPFLNRKTLCSIKNCAKMGHSFFILYIIYKANNMKSLSEHGKGRLFIIATALLYGLAGVCVKSIPWSPFSIMAARCVFSIIILEIGRKGKRLRLSKKVLLGAAFEAATGILYMSAIKLTTAATAIVLQYIAPILVFLFTVVVQRTRPKLSEMLIVFAVFGGCALSFADGLDPTRMLGNLLGIVSGVTFAGQIIVFSDPEINAEDGVLLSNIISLLVCFPFWFFDPSLVFTKKAIFWVVVLGVFQYGLANLCYAHGCRRLGKIETSLLLTIEPIFNPIPVWIVTGEKMGPLALAGFVIVIAGVTLYGLLPVIRKRSADGIN